MPALNFPNSPSVNDTYSANGKVWVWDGVTWKGLASSLAEDTYASASSITPNVNTTEIITVTALAEALTINNPTGVLSQGKRLVIRIKDNGTARALSFGTQYRGGTDLALPTTTTATKTLYLGFTWNTTDTKFDIIALLDNI